jgi:allantoinase
VLPGAIDGQTHARSERDREDFLWATRAAAAGGVTTIVDMPYDAGQLICDAARVRQKAAEAATQARVDFALYGTVHPEQGTTHVDEMVDAGICAIKVSTFGTDPERFPRIPPPLIHDVMAALRPHGVATCVHNEDDESVRACTARVLAEGRSDPRSHGLARPPYTEMLATVQVYETGASTGARAHVVHCSQSRGYELARMYREQGHAATIEACLHYLILDEEHDVNRLGGFAKVNPPIRSRREREALWGHLARGNVTLVSTDHVSWSRGRKDQPDMLANASGVPGLEVLYPLLARECLRRGIDLVRLVRVLADGPARLFGIDHAKGALAVGRDADITVLVPQPRRYDPRASGHNVADWSPYEGEELPLAVGATFLRGRLAFDGRAVVAAPGDGHFLRPGSAA